MSKKPCKTCNEKKRYANLSICYTCYRTREKKKKEEKALKKKLRKESTKKFQDSLKKTLMNKAWKLMSKYIRSLYLNSQGYVECYTCGKKGEFKEMHCGHLFHGRLDLDTRNLKPQCYSCNVGNSGRREIYMSRLIREVGLEEVQQLEADAWKKGNNYSVEELGEIMKDLTNKIKELDYENKNT